MALKINASSWFVSQYLVVESEGVKYRETAIAGGLRRFRFEEILCVLLAPDNRLSFQVGEEVFTIQTQPKNKKHQAVIAALVEGVQRWTGSIAQ